MYFNDAIDILIHKTNLLKKLNTCILILYHSYYKQYKYIYKWMKVRLFSISSWNKILIFLKLVNHLNNQEINFIIEK